MPHYGYALSEEAVGIFARLPVKSRRRLLSALNDLARSPFQTGDYHEKGASGRNYELKLWDDLLITWWVDHATTEVRVVRIEQID